MNQKSSVIFTMLALSYSSITLNFDKYCIKNDYQAHSKVYKAFDDLGSHSSGDTNEAVYLYARKLALNHNYTRILDVGCGTGRQIVVNLNEFDTIGYDVPHIIEFAKKYAPNKCWRICDFNNPVAPPTEEFDLVICHRVLHHLVEPDNLMRWLSQVKCKKIIISTSDRNEFEKIRQRLDFGPPISEFNVREWGFEEFKNYAAQWFIVDRHFRSSPSYTQVVECHLK